MSRISQETLSAYFTLLVAIAIAAVAAWYSIVGLMAIFAAAAIPIAIMGGVLEVGKLVTASWLYNHWNTSPILLKTYLTSAVAILMLITSMGIFGFLSKAHIDQGVGSGDATAKIQRIEKKVSTEQKVIQRSETLLQTFDDALDRYIELGAITKGLGKREEQAAEREVASAAIKKAEEKIDELENEKAELLSEVRAFEVEVGPIKYIADLIYEDGKDNLDEAVRAVILLLIFVFDPLAVLLLVAANIQLNQIKEVQPEPKSNNEIVSFTEKGEPITLEDERKLVDRNGNRWIKNRVGGRWTKWLIDEK